jgi:Mrp family chromosome partitioning ATPase
MTKIFEALEYAGLERDSHRATEGRILPALQEPDINPALYAKTVPKPSVGEIANSAGSLFQNIITLLPGRESRIIQFQGTQKGEGTSTLVRKLASLAAIKLQKNVLLLDLNQQAPNQCSFFNVQSELPLSDSPGLRKLTRGDFARVDESSLYVTQLPTKGLPANNICEMSQIGPLLKGLKEEFDLILIDSPAAISCSEWLLLTPKVDGVVLVVQAEKTRWQTVNKVKERILAQNGKILGVVLNKRRYPIPDFIYNRI